MLDMFHIAAEVAKAKIDLRYFRIGAVAIRGDGTIVKAANGPTKTPCPHTHAEVRLSRKLDVGATVFVARVGKGTGEFRLAKPCPNCERVLRSKGVKKVYYTTGPDTWECFDF